MWNYTEKMEDSTQKGILYIIYKYNICVVLKLKNHMYLAKNCDLKNKNF